MNDMTLSPSRKTCHNGGCEGCDCKSGGDQATLIAHPSDEQLAILKRATGMHLSRSGSPYRNSLRCAEASRQYGQALELCEMGLMARVGDTYSRRDGVAELASFRVTNAGALILGVNSARELTRDEE